MWKRLRVWTQRRRFEADLAEEVRIHRELAKECGRQFGPEALALENSRAVWGVGWMDTLRQDVRYALRSFRKSPAFALTVIGTIGLGLGLNTTMFTVFDAYVLKTVAVRDPHSLYNVWWKSSSGRWRASWRPFQDLRKQGIVFSDVAATEVLAAPLDGRFEWGALVSGNYFQMVQPGVLMGRLIEPEDAAVPGAGAVMVISYATWKNRYGGDPAILGRKVRLRNQPFEIIGVTSPSFSGLGEVPLDCWIPLSTHSLVNDGPDLFGPAQPDTLRLTARLKPGVTPETARAAVWTWASHINAGLPGDERVRSVKVMSAATAIALTPQTLVTFAPVFVAFGLVLAISCANVSNMMLARALARQREIGIRLSLGAGRPRLIRKLLTESLLLAAPAAAAGMAISQATIGCAQWLMMATVPAAFSKIIRVPQLAPNARVFLFMLAASVAATLVFGLIPAIQTTRTALVQANRGDFSSDHRPSRLRSILVTAQAAVCSLFLIYAGVMLRSELRVTAVDVGMRTAGVFDVRASARFHAQAEQKLAALPGIEAANVWRAPLYGELRQMGVIPGGGRNEFQAGYNFVSPEYFSVLRIPLVRGRFFTAEEARGQAAVAVISEATARKFWPGQDALGQSIAISSGRQKDERSDRLPSFCASQVIGIARDATNGFVANGVDSTCIYFPTFGTVGNESLLVSVKGGKDSGKRLLEGALNGIVDQINPMDEVLATMIYPFRVAFWITGFLAALALVLTVSGIYGVLSYLVSQRSKEIGVRLALGASAGAVVRMVVSQSMRMAGVGIALGVAFALMVAPLFAHQLQTMEPYDGAVYVAGAALVTLAALAAACFPCRRAAQIDPVITLRCD